MQPAYVHLIGPALHKYAVQIQAAVDLVTIAAEIVADEAAEAERLAAEMAVAQEAEMERIVAAAEDVLRTIADEKVAPGADEDTP